MLLRDATVATPRPPGVGEDQPADRRRASRRAGPRARSRRGRGGPGPRGSARAARPRERPHPPLQRPRARDAAARRSPRGASSRSLEKVWWRLDRALDEESVYLSGLVGAIEAARCGTTTLVRPPRLAFRASRDRSRRCGGAIEAVGLRSVLCYETTDRNGIDGRDAGIAENRAFLAAGRSALTRGLVGAHASFTLSDESLDLLAGAVRDGPLEPARPRGRGPGRRRDCRGRTGTGLVERLRRHGLLGARAILVHGVHLGEDELRDAQAAGAWLVHCPRSNMNNAVGHAPTGPSGGRPSAPTASTRTCWPRPGRLPRDAGGRAGGRAPRGRRHARGRTPAGGGPLRRSPGGSTPALPPTS